MAGTRLLIGTSKGAFLAEWDEGTPRATGPHCDGWPINHVIGDRSADTIWAAGGSSFFGAGVWRSRDGGANWTASWFAHGEREALIAENPEFFAGRGMTPAGPAQFDVEVDAVWSLGRDGATLYAGAKPAALYRSDDDGESWTRVDSLTDHPSRPDWQPGGAGLSLHSIVSDPGARGRLWVGISAAGAFATEDGGTSWDRRNRLANAPASAPAAPGHDHGTEVGACVHNIVRAHAGGGDLMYQQNHHGVFRSPDGGRSWHDITAGLPSGFGFPIVADPADAERIWVVPLNGDVAGRFPPDAAAAVWTSADGGATWSAERQGLPQENCFFTVLRQAMATARGEAGTEVYFGTNSGSIFARTPDGSWHEILRHLPTILSVETM